MTRVIATFLFVGLLKPAPGTWGSLAALPVFFGLHVIGGPPLCVAAIASILAIGAWAASAETRRLGLADPDEIVVDEVAGQWIALLPLSFGAVSAGVGIGALWPGWIAAFAFFRLFDIWKPGPVGWADRRGDLIGLMLDDLIAGLLAALSVVILAAAAHGMLV
jgi:phosphatidylglycerophosphatase A